jgi:hypothetical protein
MTKEDVKDTIECREQIVRYFDYLEKGNEGIPEEFFMHVLHNILTQASLIALKEVLERINDKLSIDVDLKKETLKSADDNYNKAKDKAIKHCLILEIKHKLLRSDSKKQFVNIR